MPADKVEFAPLDDLETPLGARRERVIRLSKLAELLWADIIQGDYWQTMGDPEDRRSKRGRGRVFEKGLIDQFRGALDDIAKETGGRMRFISSEEHRTLSIETVIKTMEEARKGELPEVTEEAEYRQLTGPDD